MLTIKNIHSPKQGNYPEWGDSSRRESSCFRNGNTADAVGQWETALQIRIDQNYLGEKLQDPTSQGEVGGLNKPGFYYPYHHNTGTNLYNTGSPGPGRGN